jgi:hypothetical protein
MGYSMSKRISNKTKVAHIFQSKDNKDLGRVPQRSAKRGIGAYEIKKGEFKKLVLENGHQQLAATNGGLTLFSKFETGFSRTNWEEMGWQVGPSVIIDSASSKRDVDVRKYVSEIDEYTNPRTFEKLVQSMEDLNGFMYHHGAHNHDLSRYKDKPADEYPGLKMGDGESSSDFATRLIAYGHGNTQENGACGNALSAGYILQSGYPISMICPTPAKNPHAGIDGYDDFVLLTENNNDVQKGYSISVKVAGTTQAQHLRIMGVAPTGYDLIFIIAKLPNRGARKSDILGGANMELRLPFGGRRWNLPPRRPGLRRSHAADNGSASQHAQRRQPGDLFRPGRWWA